MATKVKSGRSSIRSGNPSHPIQNRSVKTVRRNGYILQNERLNIRKSRRHGIQMAIFNKSNSNKNVSGPTVWARPEMQVTFRAEIMPNKNREERTFRISTVLPNGRVTLHGFPDEHRQGSFEPTKFLRKRTA